MALCAKPVAPPRMLSTKWDNPDWSKARRNCLVASRRILDDRLEFEDDLSQSNFLQRPMFGPMFGLPEFPIERGEEQAMTAKQPRIILQLPGDAE